MHSFEAMARALYFYEQNEHFNGCCKIVSRIFTHPKAKEWSTFNIRATELIEKEQPYWGTEIKGENTDIFTYQFSPIDGFECQSLLLTFYSTTKVIVILSGMTQEEIDEIKPKFSFINKKIFGDLE